MPQVTRAKHEDRKCNCESGASSGRTFCRALGAGEDLKGFDVDNRWGKSALDRIYSDILGQSDATPGVQVSSYCNI